MNGSARKTRSKFCVLHGRRAAQTRRKGGRVGGDSACLKLSWDRWDWGKVVVDLVLTARCHVKDRVVYPFYAELNTDSLTHTLVSITTPTNISCIDPSGEELTMPLGIGLGYMI